MQHKHIQSSLFFFLFFSFSSPKRFYQKKTNIVATAINNYWCGLEDCCCFFISFYLFFLFLDDFNFWLCFAVTLTLCTTIIIGSCPWRMLHIIVHHPISTRFSSKWTWWSCGFVRKNQLISGLVRGWCLNAKCRWHSVGRWVAVFNVGGEIHFFWAFF